MKKIIIGILLTVLVSYVVATFILHRKIDKWEWSEEMLKPEKLTFPKDFIWGTASASYQVEGGHGIEDSWGWWETQKTNYGAPRVKGKNGISNDEWNLYPRDINNMNILGVDSYRFSISWSKIEPQQGVIKEEALKHYDDLIDSLLANNIKPMITLHHFSHPTWFEKLGAFDKEENIEHFVKFSELVFNRYSSKVKFWTTFNEPAVYAYGRHIDMNHPTPTTEPDFNKLGTMLKHTLIAHDKVYASFKKTSNGHKVKVGIVKSFMQMDPYSSYDLGDQVMAYYADKLFLKAYLNYFKNGIFDFKAFPVGADVEYKNVDSVGENLDFIGLNYYSHNAFNFDWLTFDLDKSAKPLYYPGEEKTDLDYGFYPEGLYRAIREASVLKKPIYITENGIGVGPKKEKLRKKHLQTALYDISKAVAEGYDVKAFYYWSLNDNFEWDLGFSKKFGLSSVNRTTLKRTLKKSGHLYKDYIKASNKKLHIIRPEINKTKENRDIKKNTKTKVSSIILDSTEVNAVFSKIKKKNLKIKFPIVRVYKYSDKSGENYLVLTERKNIRIGEDMEQANDSIKLFNFVLKNGVFKKKWSHSDSIINDEISLEDEKSIWFWTKYMEIKDYDNDGFMELIIVCGASLNDTDDRGLEDYTRLKIRIYHKDQNKEIRHYNADQDLDRHTDVDASVFGLPIEIKKRIKYLLKKIRRNNHSSFNKIDVSGKKRYQFEEEQLLVP